MRDNQGQWLRALAALVDKVDVPPINRGMKVGKRVDGLFLRAPVELCLPVIDDWEM
jgi:hypothetical protein